jgi:hypothetical protein
MVAAASLHRADDTSKIERETRSGALTDDPARRPGPRSGDSRGSALVFTMTLLIVDLMGVFFVRFGVPVLAERLGTAELVKMSSAAVLGMAIGALIAYIFSAYVRSAIGTAPTSRISCGRVTIVVPIAVLGLTTASVVALEQHLGLVRAAETGHIARSALVVLLCTISGAVAWIFIALAGRLLAGSSFGRQPHRVALLASLAIMLVGFAGTALSRIVTWYIVVHR